MLDIFYLKRKDLAYMNALLYAFKFIQNRYRIPDDILNSIALDVCMDYHRYRTYKCNTTLDAHKKPVTCLTLTSDNNYVISGSDDGKIKIWEMVTGKCLHTLSSRDCSVKSIQISKNNSNFFSLDTGNIIRKWDLWSGTHLDTINPYNKPATTFTLLPNDTIVIGYENGVLQIESTRNKDAEPLILDTNSHSVRSLLYKDNFLISTRENITIWNLTDIKHPIYLKDPHNDPLIHAATLDNKHIIVGLLKNNIIKIMTQSGKVISNLHQNSDTFYNSIVITPDDKYIILGSSNNKILISDPQTSKLVTHLYSHTNGVTAIAITADSNYLVSGSVDGTIKIWKESLPDILKNIPDWQSKVACLLLSIPAHH